MMGDLVKHAGVTFPAFIADYASNDAEVRRVEDDTMAPTLKTGDWVLIDRSSDKIPTLDCGYSVFLIRAHGCEMYRRVGDMPGDRYCVYCDNAGRYDPLWQPKRDDVEILGRVRFCLARPIC
ncbi:MAG: S24/S26 family peptidase [Pseudomonadota bacterium]